MKTRLTDIACALMMKRIGPNMHVVRHSSLIFGRKELYFLYILLNNLCNFYFRLALFNLDLKKFFKSSGGVIVQGFSFFVWNNTTLTEMIFVYFNTN